MNRALPMTILRTAVLRSLPSVLGLMVLAGGQPAPAQTAAEYRQLGLSYRSQERFPEAITSLAKSVELEPNNLSGRVLLGWTQHLAGQRQAAAQTLLEAVQQDWTSVPALNALGIVYLVEGDLVSAVLTHSWAALLKPDNEIAYYNLSLSYHRLQDYPQAIGHALRAIELEPSNPHPLVALAINYWDGGDRPKAQQTYRRALELDGRYRERSFLSHLKDAGFSQTQIQVTEQILTTL